MSINYSVDISGIDKVVLLRKMWASMAPASFFRMMPAAVPGFDATLAKEAVKKYIDYFQGRCIKTDLSGDVADSRLYDRDAGTGAMQRIVDGIRASM